MGPTRIDELQTIDSRVLRRLIKLTMKNPNTNKIATVVTYNDASAEMNRSLVIIKIKAVFIFEQIKSMEKDMLGLVLI